MSKVDNRIVNMQFNNREFEKGIKETTGSLEELKRGLDLQGTQSIARGVDNLQGRFSNLGIVGITALQDITRVAMNTGKKIAGSVVDPIFAGGKRRALNIQQAEFMFKGLGVEVEAAMASANEAVMGTAYGLDEAAMVAAQFTASGVQVGDELTKSLLGVSGVAAMTGSAYSDIGRIFTTVAGNGRLMTNELRQMEGRGLNVSVALGDHFGKTEAEIREMTTKGLISFEMFSEAMSETFGPHAKKANELYTGSLSNLKGAFSRMGASFYTPVLFQLRDIFGALRPVVDDLHNALKPLIKQLTDFTGRVAEKIIAFLEGIDFSGIGEGVSIFGTFGGILGSLGSAFTSFGGVVRESMGLLGPIFGAAFKVFELFADSLKYIIMYAKELVDPLRRLGKSITDVMVNVSGAEEGTSVFQIALYSLSVILDKVSRGLVKVIEWLTKLIDPTFVAGEKIERVSEASGILGRTMEILRGIVDRLADRFTWLRPTIDAVRNALSKITDVFKGVTGEGTFFEKVLNSIKWGLDGIKAVLSLLTPYLKDFIAGFKEVFKDFNMGDALNVGAIALVIGNLKKAFGKLSSLFGSGMGIIGGYSLAMREFGHSLMGWQSSLKAGTIAKIAGSVAILAIALLAMTAVDPGKLVAASAAIGLLMVELVGAMVALNALGGSAGKMGKATTQMIKMSVAVYILARAMKAIGDLDLDSMVAGVGSIGIIMTMLVTMSSAMGKASAGLAKNSKGLITFAIAIGILVRSVEKLGNMDLGVLLKGLLSLGVILLGLSLFLESANFDELGFSQGAGLMLVANAISSLGNTVKKLGNLSVKEIIKGLGTLGLVLAQIAIFTNFMGDEMEGLATAATLVALAVAIRLLVKAITTLGNLSVKEIIKGVGSLAMVLGLLTATVHLMPDKKLFGLAVALGALAVAISIIAGAIVKLGGLSVGELVVGLTGLAGALFILGVAMQVMKGTVTGSLSLLVMAGALAILTPILLVFASMSLGGILKSLGMLAGVFAILGGAALLLTPLIPAMLGLAVALTIFGAGLLITGAALFVVSIAFGAAAKAIEAAIISIVSAVTVVATAVPQLLKLMGDAMIVAAETAVKVLSVILDGFLELLQKLASLIPDYVKAGTDIIIGLLNGFTDNIGDIIEAGVDAALAFIFGVTAQLPKIIDAGFDFVIGFINGLAETIRTRTPELLEAGTNLITAVLGAIIEGIKAVPGIGWSLVKELIGGIFCKREDAKTEGKGLIASVLSSMSGAISGAWQIGADLMSGFVNGMKSFGKRVKETASGLASSASNAIKKRLDIQSPSRVLMGLGEDTGRGFSMGISSMIDDVALTADKLGSGVIDSIDNIMNNMNALVSGDVALEPSVRPVLDMSGVGTLDMEKSFKGFRQEYAGLGPVVTMEQQVSMTHSFDTLTVEGVNDENEFVATADYAVEDILTAMMRRQSRL